MKQIIRVISVASVAVVIAIFATPSIADTVHTTKEISPYPIIMDKSPRTCNDWVAHRHTHDASEKEDMAFLYGFFSGYNAFKQPAPRVFLTQDANNLLQVMDRYCTKYPKDHIATVAIKVINDLHKQPM